ncbi:MAG: hypothetical protein ACI8XB_002623 [Patiriisocius sp.]|jgi:hypothetical protein
MALLPLVESSLAFSAFTEPYSVPPKAALRFMSRFDHFLPSFNLPTSLPLLHFCGCTQNSIGRKN